MLWVVFLIGQKYICESELKKIKQYSIPNGESEICGQIHQYLLDEKKNCINVLYFQKIPKVKSRSNSLRGITEASEVRGSRNVSGIESSFLDL